MLRIKSFQFNPVQENTYVVYNEFNDCFIIDPGCYYEGEKEELTSFIQTNTLTPKLLLNTHCHLDHVFGNKDIAARFKLDLHIHEKEKEMLELAPASGLMYNLPFDNYTGDLKFLMPGELLKLGEDELKILYTPGHSPGSLSFYCAQDQFVISGDALFKRSIGRTDLPRGNHQQLLDSIQSQLMTLPDETRVYSGHGEVTTIGEERRMNPFLITNRSDKLI